jgi:23S rRNA (guanine2445-N2)-methyltransferase / 23S rRNA (guanine2069-N7)-methyltransferase
MSALRYNFFASCARGVEPILNEELRAIGASETAPSAGGVRFTGPLDTALRACLWSRTAGRVFLTLGRSIVENTGEIYEAVRGIPWEEHVAPKATIAVDFSGTGAGVSNTMFGALLVKDAVVDYLRDRRGERPSVNPDRPDLLINCHLARYGLEVRIDLSGSSLHLRGYRTESGTAPLRETLAAALLLKAGWPAIAGEGGCFIDPLCGSGTLVIEAAMIAASAAPGLFRDRWGFTAWPGFDRAVWDGLVEEAHALREAGIQKAPVCLGFDIDKQVIKIARHNAKRALLDTLVRFETRALEKAAPVEGMKPGLVMTNPPYGVRLKNEGDLGALYALLGDTVKARFQGWHAAVFTGEPELGKRMGLRAHRTNVFYNGPLECRLLQFSVESNRFVDREALDARAGRIGIERALGRGADAFLNRIKKNIRAIGAWAKREGISCYRLYDADLPEYAVAIDIYGVRAHVQEYAAPASIDAAKAAERLNDAITVLPGALGIPADHVILKVRHRQKGKSQYQKQDERGEFIEVAEGPCRFLINLTDYLDTGLFLDHRPTREMIRRLAKGKRFLNLFCYTGTATVHAAAGGAVSTVSVDMSPVYLEWAQRNFDLNGVGGKAHQIVRADCLEWIGLCKTRFDLIFLDPPTFSNSKRMQGTFDVQRDHAGLIRETARLLTPGGTLFFSNNRSKFKFDNEALSGLSVIDISAETIPRDFERNPRIHRCWKIQKQ